jgi:hypothetical protein
VRQDDELQLERNANLRETQIGIAEEREVYFVLELARRHQEDELVLEGNAHCFLVVERDLEGNAKCVSSWRWCAGMMNYRIGGEREAYLVQLLVHQAGKLELQRNA